MVLLGNKCSEDSHSTPVIAYSYNPHALFSSLIICSEHARLDDAEHSAILIVSNCHMLLCIESICSLIM